MTIMVLMSIAVIHELITLFSNQTNLEEGRHKTNFQRSGGVGGVGKDWPEVHISVQTVKEKHIGPKKKGRK